MGAKMTGSEFNAFMDWEVWEEDDLYWDETTFKLNGSEVSNLPEKLKPTDQVEILAGEVLSNETDFCISATAFAKRFLKQRNTVTVILEVPREQHADTLAALADLRRTIPKIRVL
jgi:hypothetical protein